MSAKPHRRPLHRRTGWLGLVAVGALATGGPMAAQEASRGALMPVTVSGGFMVSARARAADPEAGRVTAGFNSALYPSLKLSPRWFLYSAIQVNSEPFRFYEAFYPERELEARLQQAFLGYSRVGEETTLSVTMGHLPSAFGSFPLRYDDATNALLDEPAIYAYPVRLRPDQLPCGTADLEHQIEYPVYVNHYCGGSDEERGGMTPTTLYGLPGLEVDLSWSRFDMRLQLTGSSPVNPQSFRSSSQHLQWTTGGGFTIRQGFRVGVSGFRGAFLEDSVTPFIGPGASFSDYPAVGFGTDVQWGAGRWKVDAEWQHIRFNYPGFQTSPAISAGYAEVKSTLTPRLFAGARIGFEDYRRVEDSGGVVARSFLPDRQSFELAVGYHLSRAQSLKVGYEWLRVPGGTGQPTGVFGLRLVTAVHSLGRAF